MRLKERNSCYKSQSVRFITSLPTSDVFIFLPGKDQNEVGTNIKDYFEHLGIISKFLYQVAKNVEFGNRMR